MYNKFRSKEVASNEHKLISITREEVQELEKEWERVSEENLNIYRQQQTKASEAYEEVKDVFNKHGITYRKPSVKIFKEGKSYKWYLDILRQIDFKYKVNTYFYNKPYEKPRISIKGNYGGRECETLIEAWDTVSKRALEKEEKAIKEQKNMIIKAKFIVKYNMPDFCTWNSIVETIVEKDKYLMLAHYLMKNRGDWSDGFNYVKYAIQHFSIKSDMDQLIYDELTEILNDPDIQDGRVFRDCFYNYNMLLGFVANNELLEDYEVVREYSTLED